MADTTVDTSMYNTIKPPAPMNVIDTVQGMQKIQMTQQEMAYRKAMSQMLPQVSDAKGNIDVGKLISLGAGNPNVAYKLPELTEQFLKNKLIDEQGLGKQIENDLAKQKIVFDNSAALAALGDKVTLNDMTRTLTNPMTLKAIGWTSKDATDYIKKLQAQGITGGPRLAQHILEVQLASGGAMESLNKINALTKGVTTGAARDENGNIIPKGTPYEGARQQVAPLQGTPKEGEQIIEPGQTDAQKRVPTLSITKGKNGETVMAPTGALPTADATIGGSPGKTESRVPMAQRPGSIITGQSPDTAVSQEQFAKEYEPGLGDRVSNARTTIAMADQMKDIAKKLRTGGGAEFRLSVAKAAQALGMPRDFIDGIGNKSVGDSEVFKKFAITLGTMLSTGLIHEGGGRLAMQEWNKIVNEASPQLSTDPRAIDKMVKFASALAKINIHEQAALKQFKAEGGDVTQWRSEWGPLGYHLLQRSLKDLHQEDKKK